tara:strand:- start:140 stop:316 length:177 start_codon:yes stop_codon:yes gene_type:complete
MHKKLKYPKGRKSLAVDYDTYNQLQELCHVEHRSIIDQLRFLIESRHEKLSYKKAARG